MLLITGQFTAKPERREELIQLAQSLFEPSRAEKGCISYNFYEETIGENCFLFFEEWVSQEAIDEHLKTLHFKKFLQLFPQLVVKQPSIKIYEIKEVRNL